LTEFTAQDDATRRSLRRDLLRWYRHRRRNLPWRERPSVYGTWISEIMLQQTTVRAVIPYWERFLVRFPNVAALAAASEEEVLALWSGLGYYRRARALHAAARRVMVERGGRLPSTQEGWRELPGIGSYTAGAIASIGCGELVPAVDANARRVLTRWLCPTAVAARRLKARALAAVAAALVDPHSPGDWNQALMELGARICLTIAPLCDECPVSEHCRARRAGHVAEVPPAHRRPPTTEAVLAALTLWHAGKVLLLPAAGGPVARMRGLGRPLREDLQGLWRGLWSVPLTPWYAAPAPSGAPAGEAARRAWQVWLRNSHGAASPACEICGMVTHGVTTYRLRVWVVRAVLSEDHPRFAGSIRWWAPDTAEAPVSTLARRVIARARCD
jgi:A/G-specific adenine glycosylase